jgi:AhpC/TSA family protein
MEAPMGDSSGIKRGWNAFVWAGFGVTLLAFLSYFLFFVQFPVTRDIPWVTLLVFLAAGWLLAAGVRRAFGQPGRYRGKVSGVILSSLSLVVFGLFCYIIFYEARNVPASKDAPRAGQQAPDFTLADANGKPVSLSDLLKTNRAAVLIFYRGYW